MTRLLSGRTTLDSLKKDAKRWLKAMQRADTAAYQRLRAVWPNAPAEPGLRDVQHALALEYGCDSWIALKAAIDDLALDRQSNAERAEQLLRHGWDGDVAMARRLLQRYPDISQHSIFTAAACGDVAEVQRLLARDRQAAATTDGPQKWTALAYTAYSRLDATKAVAIARLLLGAGADPNFRFDDGWGNPFTLVTGAIGLGEGAKTSHPQAVELIELLIDAGAAPFDTQALYNISIVGDDIYWYDLLWRHSEARGVTDMWRDAAGYRIGGSQPLCALDYLLGNAVGRNHLGRAGWLLERGADANTPYAYGGQSLHALAQLSGFQDMAGLLERHGVRRAALTGAQAFQAACLALDEDGSRALLAANPTLAANPAPLIAAAQYGNAQAVALLLSLGAPVGALDHQGISALHWAVQSGSLEAVDLLVAAGADVDLRERKWHGTPLSWAGVFGHTHLAQRLAPLSHDARDLTRLGFAERLEAVLSAEPERANQRGAGDEGSTPLFRLPDDEDAALRVTRILLAHGADPNSRNKQGRTAIDQARHCGLDEVAELMEGWRRAG